MQQQLEKSVATISVCNFTLYVYNNHKVIEHVTLFFSIFSK
jgi:hypothetical protein